MKITFGITQFTRNKKELTKGKKTPANLRIVNKMDASGFMYLLESFKVQVLTTFEC